MAAPASDTTRSVAFPLASTCPFVGSSKALPAPTPVFLFVRHEPALNQRSSEHLPATWQSQFLGKSSSQTGEEMVCCTAARFFLTPPTVRATGSLRCKHSKLLQANSAQLKLVDGFCKPLQPVSPQSSILQETFWSERRFRSKRYCNKTSSFDRATRSRPSLVQCPSFGSRRSFSHSLGGSRRIISEP